MANRTDSIAGKESDNRESDDDDAEIEKCYDGHLDRFIAHITQPRMRTDIVFVEQGMKEQYITDLEQREASRTPIVDSRGNRYVPLRTPLPTIIEILPSVVKQ